MSDAGEFISKRMRSLVNPAGSLVSAYFRCKENPYHAQKNPEGFIDAGTAEQHQLWPSLSAKLTAIPPLAEEDTHYQPLHGTSACRTAVARYLSRICAAEVDADELVLTGGATAALELLGFALCDAGDTVLVPAPYYSGFAHAFCLRPEVQLEAVASREGSLLLDIDALALALAKAQAEGRRVRALLISSPSNPIGEVYSHAQCDALLALAERWDLQLIVDEIYAGSCYQPEGHYSFLRSTSERVHVVYGFAKDLALSGFAVGVLRTRSKALHSVAVDLAHFSRVSNSTQRLLEYVLSDDAWVDETLAAGRALNQARLGELQAFCGREGIELIEPKAGVFAFLHLGPWLRDATQAAEAELVGALLEEARLYVAAGSGFGCTEPGWVRIAFAQPQERLAVALDRLLGFLKARRS